MINVLICVWLNSIEKIPLKKRCLRKLISKIQEVHRNNTELSEGVRGSTFIYFLILKEICIEELCEYISVEYQCYFG